MRYSCLTLTHTSFSPHRQKEKRTAANFKGTSTAWGTQAEIVSVRNTQPEVWRKKQHTTNSTLRYFHTEAEAEAQGRRRIQQEEEEEEVSPSSKPDTNLIATNKPPLPPSPTLPPRSSTSLAAKLATRACLLLQHCHKNYPIFKQTKPPTQTKQSTQSNRQTLQKKTKKTPQSHRLLRRTSEVIFTYVFPFVEPEAVHLCYSSHHTHAFTFASSLSRYPLPAFICTQSSGGCQGPVNQRRCKVLQVSHARGCCRVFPPPSSPHTSH